MKRLIFLVALLFLPTPAAQGAPVFTLQAPVPGPVVRGFDPGTGPYSAGHRGVDLAAEVGDPVRASADGVISFAGSVAGRASVSITHSGQLRTTYTAVDPAVTSGSRVRAGDVIGHVAAWPDHGCECLHWGLTDGHNYWDPLNYLHQLKLLPLGSRPEPLPAPPVSEGALPVEGPITSPFGMRTHPITGKRSLHDGVDIGASCGTPITAPWAGRVTLADYHPAYGYRVRVDHGSHVATYTHMPKLDVSVGEVLRAGDTLGVVGSTGLSTGCHLHWMVRVDGQLIDPLTLV